MSSSDEEEQFEFEENNRQMEEFEAKLRKQESSDDEPKVHAHRRSDQLPAIVQPSKIESIQSQLEFKKRGPKNLQEECEEVINSRNEPLKDKKIKELVSRNRNLQVAYEKERAGRIKIEEKLNQLLKETEESMKTLEKTMPKSQSQPKQDPLAKALKHKEPDQSKDDGDDYKAKFKEADKKIQEQRIKLQQLKSELSKATRVIAREIGENVSLDQILLDETSWKGRAQQIEILKSKVRDMTQKLGSSSQYSDNSMISKSSKMDQSKQQQSDLLKQQYELLKQEYEVQQSKMKAVSSRRQILEDQIKDIKAEYDKNKRILLDKSENDDKYIEALKQELEKCKRNTPNVETKIIYKPTDEEEHRKQKQEVKYIKEELLRKDQIIKELIADKVSRGKGEQTQQVPQVDPKVEERSRRLEDEIKLLKKERDEFFKTITKDQDTQSLIKDLTLQNVRLRNKIDDLSKK